MSTYEAKYTTTEAILNQEWPKIKGKFKLSFRCHKFLIKTHDIKETDDSLRFTIKDQPNSLFFGTKYDAFFVLTICNSNPDKSLTYNHKVPKFDENSITDKLKFTIPLHLSLMTPESGFLTEGKVCFKFYFYLLIDDEDENDDPSEEDTPGVYINEKCWKIPKFRTLTTYKSSDFTFYQNSFHFEYTKTEDDKPFSIKFVCDKIDAIDTTGFKFEFQVLNLGGHPTLLIKKDWQNIKENDHISIEFPQNSQTILDPKNGFISSNSIYFSILSKTGKYKTAGTSSINAVPVNHSKEETGYVGLVNQGATCYMNSMLQCLFHLGSFRKLVYSIRTDDENDQKKSIPLNLQRLFGRLQLSSDPCSTEALTVSFGWDFSRTIIQHDTQEFCRVLLDNLQAKLQKKIKEASNKSDDQISGQNNSEKEDGIAKLFQGKFRSFFRCINVDFESARTESFYDLTMDVEGCNSLTDSFKKYVQTEKMEGENQYNTDDPRFGKQDAIMGTEFVSLPPVLMLHLSRFKYDYYSDRMVKINDRFEFDEEIDLSPFVVHSKSESEKVDDLYVLYGVLVHSGTVSSGHYYAFLRTRPSDQQWYEFNDSYVTKVDKKTAIENNFGGSNSPSSSSSGYHYYGYEKSFSAYILVYVRKSDCDWVFEEIKDDMIPERVKQFIENPESFSEAETAGQKDEEEEKEIKLDVSLEESIDFNLLTGKTGFTCEKFSKEVVVSSKDLRDVVYQKVASAFNLNVDEIRLFTVYSNSPSFMFYRSNTRPYFSSVSNRLFLQHKKTDEEANLTINQIIVFLKFFCPEFEKSAPLQYIGSFIFEASQATEDTLFQKVNEILGFSEKTRYNVFIESGNGDAKTIKIDSNLRAAGVSNGSSLIFQLSKESAELNQKPSFTFKKFIEEEKNDDSPKKGEFPVFSMKNEVNDPIDYLNNLSAKMVTIPLFDYYYIYKPVCHFLAPISTDFSAFKNFMVKSLAFDYDSEKDLLNLYKKYYTHNYPGSQKVNEAITQKLKDVFSMAKTVEDFTLYFKLIKGITAEQLKEKVPIKIHFSEDSLHLSKSFFIFFEKSQKLELPDILTKIAQEANFSGGPDKLRIFSVEHKKAGKILTQKSYISPSITWIRADCLTEKTENLTESEFLLRFFVSKADVNSEVVITGEIFTLKIDLNDNFGKVKKQIQEVCGFDDELMKKLNFFVGEENVKMTPRNALNDESTFEKFRPENNVFIVLPVKKSNSSANRRKEEALKIDN